MKIGKCEIYSHPFRYADGEATEVGAAIWTLSD